MNTYYSDNGASYLLKENFYGLSGWQIDDIGGDMYIRAHECFAVTLNDARRPVVLNKILKRADKGVLTLSSAFKKRLGANVCFKLSGTDSGDFSIFTDKESVCCLADGNKYFVCECSEDVVYRFKVTVDFENRNADIWINGVKRLSVAVASLKTIDEIELSFSGEDKSQIYLLYVEIHKGFYIHERFESTAAGTLPQEWSVSSSPESDVVVQYLTGNDNIRSHVLLIEDGRRTALPTEIYRKFDACATDVFTAELKSYFPYNGDANQGIDISLCSEDNSFVTLRAARDGLYYNNECIRRYSEDVWQHIKITCDITNKNMTVIVNGKRVTDIKIKEDISFADGIKITTKPLAWTICMIAEVFVYPVMPLTEDYPSKPVKADSHGTHIGMQACNLWFDGDNVGWDLIEPWPDRKPYLGCYYDGLSEVRDWEIKWLSEHGIEFYLPCWYLPDGYKGGAFIGDELGLFDSFFNCQYKDDFKFAIQFTGIAPNLTSECFRKYVIPYWIDYYFKDPNYMVIDNKPIIAITFASGLDRIFGGEDAFIEEMDYLRNECKKLGFDGAYIIVGEQHRTQIHLDKTDRLGFDGIFSYSWGPCSELGDNQRAILTAQDKNSKTDVIPTVSQGYDERAWRGKHLGEYIKPDDFHKLLKWVKEDFMASANKESLRSKVFLLDNWNEYGEGHIYMPTDLYKFAYLDSVREIFCGKEEHIDVQPNENQKERLEALWPNGRKVLKKVKTEPDIPSKVLTGWYLNDENKSGIWKAVQDVNNLHISNGALCGEIDGKSPLIELTSPVSFNGLHSPFIRFTVKLKDVFTMLFKVYFITEDDREWNEQKSFARFICEADFETCNIFTGHNKNWQKNIVGIRIQPASSEGDFELASLEILEYEKMPMRYELDDCSNTFFAEPIIENNCILAPITDIAKKLGVLQTWDYANNIVSIDTRELSIKFPIDKPVAIVNGVEEKLPAAAQINERIAYLPIEYLCGKLSFKTEFITDKNLFRITKYKL